MGVAFVEATPFNVVRRKTLALAQTTRIGHPSWVCFRKTKGDFKVDVDTLR
jgi:hypothetical protein